MAQSASVSLPAIFFPPIKVQCFATHWLLRNLSSFVMESWMDWSRCDEMTQKWTKVQFVQPMDQRVIELKARGTEWESAVRNGKGAVEPSGQTKCSEPLRPIPWKFTLAMTPFHWLTWSSGPLNLWNSINESVSTWQIRAYEYSLLSLPSWGSSWSSIYIELIEGCLLG